VTALRLVGCGDGGYRVFRNALLQAQLRDLLFAVQNFHLLFDLFLDRAVVSAQRTDFVQVKT
jgi:hypothetical protein